MKFVDKVVEHRRVCEFLRQEVPDEWTAESIAFIQAQNCDLAIVREWVSEKKTPVWNGIVHENGAVKTWWTRRGHLFLSENEVLYLTWESDMAQGAPCYKIVATPPMYGPIMRASHDSKVGAHLG